MVQTSGRGGAQATGASGSLGARTSAGGGSGGGGGGAAQANNVATTSNNAPRCIWLPLALKKRKDITFIQQSSGAEISALIVAQRLLDFRRRVHHEGAIVGNRFAQRRTAQKQQSCARVPGPQFPGIALAGDREVSRRNVPARISQAAVVYVRYQSLTDAALNHQAIARRQ